MATRVEARSPVYVSPAVIGSWNRTYQWIPIFGGVLAFAAAFAAGANNIPVPFSTPVGSAAMTMVQASIAAWLINVPGTTFASNTTVDALFSEFLHEKQPTEGFMIWSLVIILTTTGIWLALATYLELPVSSQLSMESALLGTVLVTGGILNMPTNDKDRSKYFSVLRVALEWLAAPSIAGVLGFCFFVLLKLLVLRQEDGEKKILIFLPIYYAISVGLLCLFLIYQVIPYLTTVGSLATILAVALATLIAGLLSLLVVVPLCRKRLDGAENCSKDNKIKSPNNRSVEQLNEQELIKEVDNEKEVDFEDAFKEYMAMRVLNTVHEEDEQNCASQEITTDSEGPQELSTSIPPSISSQSTHFKQLRESTSSQLMQARKFQRIHTTSKKKHFFKSIREMKLTTFFPAMEYDRHTLIRHALAEKYDEKIEELFIFLHILASCIFALTQSANEIASIMGPYGVILDIFKHREKYSGDGHNAGHVHINWWIRTMGGLAASMGFFLYGWRLTHCLGEKLTYMSHSRGLSSQLCTVATMLIATSMKLPVSSSHSFVGSMIGVGIADDPQNVNWKLFLKFLCGWIGSIAFCCGLAYCIYSFTIHSPGYVVP